MDLVAIVSVFVIACLAGGYAVRSATPALHMPLIAVTSAISSVVVVGALIASAAAGIGSGGALSKWLGLLAVMLASISIVGGFAVTARLLAMDKK